MTSSHRWAQAVPLLAVLGSVVALGIGTSFAKQLFPLVGSLGTTALRVGFSACWLLLIWRPWRWALSKADALSLVRYGMALGCMNLMFYQSLRTIPFGVAVAIEFSGPMAVAFFTSRQRIDYLWLAFAVVGLGLLLPLGHDIATLNPEGVMFGLGAAICWAAYILFGKKVGHLHAGHSVALGLTMAAITVVPFGVWHAGSALLKPEILLYGLGVAAVSSAIPISLEMVALQRLTPAAFGVMASMEPAVAALMGVLVLDEHLTGLQWLAILLVMSAAAGSAATAKPETHRGPADEIVQ
ncbi:MAG: DMT family transporter [Hydrogenophaga sp.]|uniref:EamA family transporter n=1 Tax=Hydrogenophaga sp. TaxID=1904254 RepID=UPI001A628DFE|nr:DMT family transporter [Hydrogenophaga sp.]